MIPARITDGTRTIVQHLPNSHMKRTIPVRDVLVGPPYGDPTNVMMSAWTPTPAELMRLLAGASVIVSVAGDMMPPITVHVSGTLPIVEIGRAHV